MDKRNLTLAVVVLIILAGGAGYYFWNKQYVSSPAEDTAPQENVSFFDTFFEKLTPLNKPEQSNLKEYKDSNGIFSIKYPPAWVVKAEKGRLLSGSSLTPPGLLDQYSLEEQQFVKGLVAAATESKDSPEAYYKNLTGGSETGQTESQNLTINGYPAYMVKGNIRGVSYIIYIVSHNNRIVYFNYRTKETEEARRDDIQKSIDFAPYTTDFEAAVHSIKFLK